MEETKPWKPVWAIDRDHVQALENAFRDDDNPPTDHSMTVPISGRCACLELPTELIALIAQFCSYKGLLGLRATCRAFYQATDKRFEELYVHTTSYIMFRKEALERLVQLADHDKWGSKMRQVRLSSVFFQVPAQFDREEQLRITPQQMTHATETAYLKKRKECWKDCKRLLSAAFKRLKSRSQNVSITIEDFPCEFSTGLRPLSIYDNSAELLNVEVHSTSNGFKLASTCMTEALYHPSDLQIVARAGGFLLTTARLLHSITTSLVSLTITLEVDCDYRALDSQSDYTRGSIIDMHHSEFAMLLQTAQNLGRLCLNLSNDSWHTIHPWSMHERPSRIGRLLSGVNLKKLSKLTLGNASIEQSCLKDFICRHDRLKRVELVNIGVYDFSTSIPTVGAKSNEKIWATIDAIKDHFALRNGLHESPEGFEILFVESWEEDDDYCAPVSRIRATELGVSKGEFNSDTEQSESMSESEGDLDSDTEQSGSRSESE